jgi:hypothetical protein
VLRRMEPREKTDKERERETENREEKGEKRKIE